MSDLFNQPLSTLDVKELLLVVILVAVIWSIFK